jgi:hypothetical protein
VRKREYIETLKKQSKGGTLGLLGKRRGTERL